MKPAWRGVVLDDGTIWAWPTVLLSHNEAFGILPCIEEYRCRWRQWSPDEAPDFGRGASDEDKQLVRDWIARANGNV